MARPIPREVARRQILPSIIQMLPSKIGPIVALFRVATGIVVQSESQFICLLDDAKFTVPSDSESSGYPRSHSSLPTSLLDVVPLCGTTSECSYGCGCRCSNDLGYTSISKPFDIGSWPVGGSVFTCKSKHEASHHTAVESPSILDVERMVKDLEIQLPE